MDQIRAVQSLDTDKKRWFDFLKGMIEVTGFCMWPEKLWISFLFVSTFPLGMYFQTRMFPKFVEVKKYL